MPFNKEDFFETLTVKSNEMGQAVGRPSENGERGVDTTIVQSQADKKNARRANVKEKKQTSTRSSYFKATPKKSAKLSFTCTEELRQALQDKCIEDRTSMTNVISNILGAALDMEKGKY